MLILFFYLTYQEMMSVVCMAYCRALTVVSPDSDGLLLCLYCIGTLASLVDQVVADPEGKRQT